MPFAGHPSLELDFVLVEFTPFECGRLVLGHAVYGGVQADEDGPRNTDVQENPLLRLRHVIRPMPGNHELAPNRDDIVDLDLSRLYLGIEPVNGTHADARHLGNFAMSIGHRHQ